VRRGEHKLEAPRSLSSEPAAGLFGDVRGVIVEDHLDRGMSWVGHIKELEKLDELAASVAILDEGVDLAGEQVDTSQQADGTVALVFMIASDSRANTGAQAAGPMRSRRSPASPASRHRTQLRPRRQASFASSTA
jgi:hypothetical protein